MEGWRAVRPRKWRFSEFYGQNTQYSGLEGTQKACGYFPGKGAQSGLSLNHGLPFWLRFSFPLAVLWDSDFSLMFGPKGRMMSTRHSFLLDARSASARLRLQLGAACISSGRARVHRVRCVKLITPPFLGLSP